MTYASKFLGICDECQSVWTFTSEEARTHWETVVHAHKWDEGDDDE